MAKTILKLSPFNEQIVKEFFPLIAHIEANLLKHNAYSTAALFNIFINFYKSYNHIKLIIESNAWVFLLTKYELYLQSNNEAILQEILSFIKEIDPQNEFNFQVFFPIQEKPQGLVKEYFQQLKNILQGKF